MASGKASPRQTSPSGVVIKRLYCVGIGIFITKIFLATILCIDFHGMKKLGKI